MNKKNASPVYNIDQINNVPDDEIHHGSTWGIL